MAYSPKVIEHYERPRNIGSMDSGSPDVGTGLVGAPECGDVMKLQIKVEKIESWMRSSKPSAAVRPLRVPALPPSG